MPPQELSAILVYDDHPDIFEMHTTCSSISSFQKMKLRCPPN